MNDNKLSDFGVNFNKNKLDNGVNVFAFHRIGMPICIRAVFFAGSRFDSIPGTAHFLEHMLVAGTEKFPSKDKLAKPLEKIGGNFSASTSLNFIKLNITIPQKEDFETGVEIFEEMLLHSLFDEKVVENERGSILSEIGESEEDPRRILNDIYYQAVFKKTPLENNVIGNKNSVSTITKENLLKFKDTFLNSSRMCLIVSGGITIDECLPLLNKYLSKFEPKKYFTMPEIAIIDRENPVVHLPFKNNKQTYVKIGFRTLGVNENDSEIFSLDMIAGILGKGRASRLIKELRYEKGLVYNIGAGHSNYPDAGDFYITTSFENDKLEDVIEVIISELKKLQKDGITEDELEFIKSATIKSVFNNMQTSLSWINFHEYEMVFNPGLARTVDYFMNKTESLTLEEVNATAQKYLHKDNFYIALCGINRKPSTVW
jgi:predicted Zn-dependent peptidase